MKSHFIYKTTLISQFKLLCNNIFQELCVLETAKKLLVERCQSTWEKMNRLEEVRFKLKLDIGDKSETLEIDRDQLTLDKNCANISYKTDPIRIANT